MTNPSVPTKRQKLTLEYPVRVSPTLLYDYITESFRLQEWFADKVEMSHDGNVYTFKWSKSGERQRAEVVDKEYGAFIRFRFEGEQDAACYLEFRIVTTELSQETILVVEEFVFPSEMDGQTQLWDYQVKTLMHILGN